MISNIQQFVPSEVCLKCDGCCRFKEAKSVWRPKISVEEIETLRRKLLVKDAALKTLTDKDGFLQTKPGCGEHLCGFFNPDDHTCQIYQNRPFECALYPFILSRHEGVTNLYLHLHCPYAQENQSSDLLSRYADYLRDFFRNNQTRAFLKRNPKIIGDYGPFKDELQFLFSLGEIV